MIRATNSQLYCNESKAIKQKKRIRFAKNANEMKAKLNAWKFWLINLKTKLCAKIENFEAQRIGQEKLNRLETLKWFPLPR